jgi:hypothetical protein
MSWRLTCCYPQPRGSARIHGPLPVLLTPGSLDLSVIGRDVLDQFSLIYGRLQGVIFLLSPPDTFVLQP